VVERRVQVRPQITAVAARAESGVRSNAGACVRTQITARAGWVLRATVLMRAMRECVRTHPSAFERTWPESASSL
jgi:hypothetical protein